MKIARKVRSTISPDTDMTPMIDMCFQLIAFFTIAINFTAADQDQTVRVPSSQLAKPPEQVFQETLTLQMKYDGEILFGGNIYTLSDVDTALARQVRIMERLGQRQMNTTVYIRADKEAKAGQVQELIKKCQDLGFERFALKARVEKA